MLVGISLFFASCATIDEGAPAFIKSAADAAATAAEVAENLLVNGVISVDDANSVALTLESEVLPRIKDAEKAYGEYIVQKRVHGVDNGGLDTAQAHITFAVDYLNGVCSQLNIEHVCGGLR